MSVTLVQDMELYAEELAIASQSEIDSLVLAKTGTLGTIGSASSVGTVSGTLGTGSSLSSASSWVPGKEESGG